MFRFQLELQLKLHRQFAPVTNTNQNIWTKFEWGPMSPEH
jgi:hypothetical protein